MYAFAKKFLYILRAIYFTNCRANLFVDCLLNSLETAMNRVTNILLIKDWKSKSETQCKPLTFNKLETARRLSAKQAKKTQTPSFERVHRKRKINHPDQKTNWHSATRETAVTS